MIFSPVTIVGSLVAHAPTAETEPVLANEREERRHMRVVQACIHKSANGLVGERARSINGNQNYATSEPMMRMMMIEALWAL